MEKVVDFMVRTPYLMGLKHPNFHALMARNIFISPILLDAAIHREMEPNVEEFVASLGRSLPKVPLDLIRLRTLFSMGAFLMSSMHLRKMKPANDPDFDENFINELVRFISAGLSGEPAIAASERLPFPRPPKPS